MILNLAITALGDKGDDRSSAHLSGRPFAAGDLTAQNLTRQDPPRRNLPLPPWACHNHLFEHTSLRNAYLVLRHGESTANQERRWVSSPVSCLNGYGLSPLGRQQVRRSVTEEMRNGTIDQHTLIISSDYLRARESADEACLVLGSSPPIVDERLRERECGSMEGRVFEPDEGTTVVRSINEQDRADPFCTPFGQESTVQVMERFTRLVLDLEARYENRSLLLVCHGDILRIALCAAKKVSPGEHAQFGHISNAAIYHLRHFLQNGA